MQYHDLNIVPTLQATVHSCPFRSNPYGSISGTQPEKVAVDPELGLQVPSEKVAGVGLEGPNAFSGGTSGALEKGEGEGSDMFRPKKIKKAWFY